ncbi:sensor histidine kinase [Sulfurovum lithotrophicum]|uniref:sensor histidine kinase n=1 Tax=Sulfurovum lithotrophicum TaxID=206403 RepID=UPI0006981A90|nr:sensor histidine kinase [Sulfurovum lithotrophicum]
MNKNYKLVIIIVLLLISLIVVLSFINYKTTLTLVHDQIEEQSLPLSLDNIYTDIQKQVLQPYLITSMMANNTFIAEWLQDNEKRPDSVKNYLSAIKNKYGLLSAILVSERTRAYYTQDGFLETLNPENKDNSWYFRFKDSPDDKEINIDTNAKIDTEVIMFMNNKIFDKKDKLIGITSTGVKIGSVNSMLNMFKKKYRLEVSIYDKDQNIILAQKENQAKNLNEISEYTPFSKAISSQYATSFSFTKDEHQYFVNIKYIPELNLHILVRAKASDFTGSLKKTYYMDIFISLFITLFVALIMSAIIKSYVDKLESSNAQKDILLKEVHHRVKNNLNITTSMLGLQAMQESEDVRNHLLKSKSRIDAIAAVHEILYKQDNFSEINFYAYIKKLEASLLGMFGKNKTFTLAVDVDRSLILPLDTMIQFGLMVNEMLTNTIKYAQNKKGLEITISLEEKNGHYTFVYRDNGEEVVDIASMPMAKGLGSTFIDICVKQLDGTLTKKFEGGLWYMLVF